MAIPRTTILQVPNPDIPGNRKKFRVQYGWRGDHKSVYSYTTVLESVHGFCRNPLTDARTGYDAGNAPGGFVIPASKAQAAYNQAYGVWQYKARGASAQLGATLGEYSQSSRMVKSRATQLLNLTKYVYRRYKGKYKKSRRFRVRYPDFADYWLEYSFGWAPLIGDLHGAYKTLCEPIPEKSAYGGGGCVHEGKTGTGNPRHSYSYQYRVGVFGKIVIVNPNVALLAQLGLLNPAAVAWELVRWSFVVDWLTDMGGWISSWSDSFGVEYKDTGVKKIQYGSTSQTWTALVGTCRSNSLVATRDPGIPPLPLPNLAVLRNIGDSLTRAANAISLTVQLITSKRRG